MLLVCFDTVRSVLFNKYGFSVLASRAAVKPLTAKGTLVSAKVSTMPLISKKKKGEPTQRIDTTVYKCHEDDAIARLIGNHFEKGTLKIPYDFGPRLIAQLGGDKGGNWNVESITASVCLNPNSVYNTLMTTLYQTPANDCYENILDYTDEALVDALLRNPAYTAILKFDHSTKSVECCAAVLCLDHQGQRRCDEIFGGHILEAKYDQNRYEQSAIQLAKRHSVFCCASEDILVIGTHQFLNWGGLETFWEFKSTERVLYAEPGTFPDKFHGVFVVADGCEALGVCHGHSGDIVHSSSQTIFISGSRLFGSTLKIGDIDSLSMVNDLFDDFSEFQWETTQKIEYFFVMRDLHLFYSQDIHGQQTVLGMSNSAGHCCTVCVSSKTNFNSPNPKYCTSRTHDESLNFLTESTYRFDGKLSKSKGQLKRPIINLPIHKQSIPTHHLASGLCAMYHDGLLEITQAVESINCPEDRILLDKMAKIKDDKQLLLTQMIEYEQHLDSYRKMKNLSDVDHSEVSDIINEYGLKLSQAKEQYHFLDMQQSGCLKQLSPNNPYRKLSDFYIKKKIPVVTYRKMSMIGANQKKFENASDDLVKLFRQMALDHPNTPISKVAPILPSLLSSWKILHSSMSKHNTKPYDDAHILTLKQQHMIFRRSFNDFIVVRGRPNSKGIKHHLIDHFVEFAEYYRFSPSWVDDQRQEAVHPIIRLFARRYGRYNAAGRLELMIKSMNNATFNNC